MSDMDDFLSKVVIDSANGGREVQRHTDALKLMGQRQINITQQDQITDQKEYIRELEEAILKLKSENQQLKNDSNDNKSSMSREKAKHLGILQTTIGNGDFFIKNNIPYDPYKTPEQNMNDYELSKTKDKLTNGLYSEYESLLAQPMHVIAEKNANFKRTYEEQQIMLADWMVSQKAFKELAIEFGFDKGYTPDQVIEMGKDKKLDVLEDKNDPSHKTNASDAPEIGQRKEVLADEYKKDKSARKAKKSS